MVVEINKNLNNELIIPTELVNSFGGQNAMDAINIAKKKETTNELQLPVEAQNLINAGKVFELGEFDKKYHKEIVNQLIVKGLGEKVAYHLDRFEGLDHKEIANKLIDAGQWRAVAAYLEKFKGLDEETMNKLIEPDLNATVNLEKFAGLDEVLKGLDKETINRLIEAGYGHLMVEHPEKFGLRRKE